MVPVPRVNLRQCHYDMRNNLIKRGNTCLSSMAIWEEPNGSGVEGGGWE